MDGWDGRGRYRWKIILLTITEFINSIMLNKCMHEYNPIDTISQYIISRMKIGSKLIIPISGQLFQSPNPKTTHLGYQTYFTPRKNRMNSILH
jgi:hypothetical protein